jgi:hypothetical protein
MTAKQKAARAKFKAVVAEAKKLRKKNPKLTQAQAVKQAWAISYSKAGKKPAKKKVGAIKIVEKGESKKAKPKATYQQVRSKKGTYKGLKKVGAVSEWGVYVGSKLREKFSDEMAAYRYADLIRSTQRLPSSFVKVKKVRKTKSVGAASSKVKARKGRSTEMHTDTKSHNVNIRVVSGISKPKASIVELSKKISKLTDINDHNSSILLLAKFLKEKKAIELMNYIKKMHNTYGSMPQQLIQLRNNILDALLQKVKDKYGYVDYQLINNSF